MGNLKIHQSKVVLSSLVGNTLEWFDFAVYGFIAPLISEKFFPSHDPIASLLMTYGVFALGFLSRPLGAIFLGHIGDTHGRKKALSYSIILMAFPTCMMGCLPTYETIGIFAPILLIICRILQGMSIGGEYTGSFIFLVEHAPKNKKGFYSCWADIGLGAGMILGSLFAALLTYMISPEAFKNFGWRIPFISGLLLAILGFYIRRHLPETPEFENQKTHRLPLKKLMSTNLMEVALVTVFVSLNATAFYLLLVFIPNQTILLGKLSPFTSYFINSLVTLFVMISTLLSSYFSDHIPGWKIISFGYIGCFLLAYPLFHSLSDFDLMHQIGLMCAFSVFLGLCFGPRASFLVPIFPGPVRYSGLSLSFNIGNGIFGGLAPVAATYLVHKTGAISSPAVIVMATALISLMTCLTIASRNHRINMLTENQ